MIRLLAATPDRFLILAAVMEILYLVLRFQGDLRFQIPETIGLLLLTSTFYIVSVFLSLRIAPGGPVSAPRWAVIVVAPALLFRLTVWPMYPGLSDDPFRYRWEGLAQAHGWNPYQSRPADTELAGLRDETYARIPGKDVKATYGPLIELIERAAYGIVSQFTADPWRQVFWFKAPAAFFDLGLLMALWALLAAHGLPPARLLIYAWSPLPLVEFWASGHNDSITLVFVVLALFLAARDRWMPAFASLTLAASAKVWPLLLFPIFVGWKGWRPARWYQWVIFLPIAGLLASPYWSDVEQNIRFMSGFLGGWRNNDSLYGLLLWITGDQYPAKYSAFAIVGVAVLTVTLLRWPLERASLTAITVMLMVSANCHPWYLTWLLPLLVFHPVPALLLWTILAPLAYKVVIAWTLLGQWDGSTPWRWWIYVPVYGLLIVTAAATRLQSKPHVHPASG